MTAESIGRLQEWANGRCLPVDRGGICECSDSKDTARRLGRQADALNNNY